MTKNEIIKLARYSRKQRYNALRTTSSVIGIIDINKKVLRCYQYTKTGIEKVSVKSTPAVFVQEKLEKLLFPKRLKVVFGGRAGGKTNTFARLFIEKTRVQEHKILCGRDLETTLEESTHAELKTVINESDLRSEFRILRNKIINTSTGSQFLFSGISRNVSSKLKSKSHVTIAWVDEAEALTEEGWEVLEPTVRIDDSEIWVSFNPKHESDKAWQEFVAPYFDKIVNGIYEDDHILLINVNYTDNTFASQTTKDSAERKKILNYLLFRHIWLGEFYKNDKEIIKEMWWHFYDPTKLNVFRMCKYLFMTGDTAYTANTENDPSCFCFWGITSGINPKLMLIDMLHLYAEFPLLLSKTSDFFSKNDKSGLGNPIRRLYVEAKASGLSLIQTLRQKKIIIPNRKDKRIPAYPWLPKAFGYPDDKVGRVNASTDAIEKGLVLLPDYDIPGYKWAKDMVDECSEFTDDDSHEHDDRVDNLTMAVSIYNWKTKNAKRK